MSPNRKLRRAGTFRTSTMTLAELRELPNGCAWYGCDQMFSGPMPAGWRWMIAYHSPQPIPSFLDIPQQNMQRDCCICPKHAQELDDQLVALCRLGDMPVMGEG